jgi:hypothetical protein
VLEDVDIISIVMMVDVHAIQGTQEEIVISELVQMIALDMVIASMDHATVVLGGLVMIAHLKCAPADALVMVNVSMPHVFASQVMQDWIAL